MEFVERMGKELQELDTRAIKLEDFIDTGKFAELSLHERDLLMMQLSAMNQYRYTLRCRLDFYNEG